MRLGLYIRKKRKELGLSKSALAKQMGLSLDTLSDLEEFDDDEINSFTIPEFKKMCKALNIDPGIFFQSNINEYGQITLPQLITKRRKERKLSKTDLAEQIGYEEVVVESLENDCNKDQVCIEAIKMISSELDIPLDYILKNI